MCEMCTKFKKKSSEELPSVALVMLAQAVKTQTNNADRADHGDGHEQKVLAKDN